MIVASLLLILVAVTLLVLGLIGGSSALLIGSIVASLLAAVALVIGARQAAAHRRTAAPDHADGDVVDVVAPVREEPALIAQPVRVGADPPTPPKSEQAPSVATPFEDDPYRAEAYEAGRRDAEEELAPAAAPPDVTQTLQPDPDLYAPDAEGLSSSSPSSSSRDDRDVGDLSASPRAGRRDADDPDYDRASSFIGGARATDDDANALRPDPASSDPAPAGSASSDPALADPALAGPASAGSAPARGDDLGPASARGAGLAGVKERGRVAPEDDPPLFAEGSAGATAGEFGDRAAQEAPADEFGDPDPDDPDDEPLPQKVRPADAVRVARLDAEVLVVDGRPRYHLADCPHLVGRLTEALPAAEAVELGFSPCGLCRPVDRLVASATRR